METFSADIIVITLKFWNRVGKKRRAPTNDEDPRKQIWEIMNVRSISIKKHEMETWYYGPTLPATWPHSHITI